MQCEQLVQREGVDAALLHTTGCIFFTVFHSFSQIFSPGFEVKPLHACALHRGVGQVLLRAPHRVDVCARRLQPGQLLVLCILLVHRLLLLQVLQLTHLGVQSTQAEWAGTQAEWALSLFELVS